MLNFTPARTRAILDIYDLHRSWEGDRFRSEIAEHALDLALSAKRPDAYLVRSALRNSQTTIVAKQKREYRRTIKLPANDNGPPTEALEAQMAKDDLCNSAQPPSPERDLEMRAAYTLLLEAVELRLGRDGADVMRRYEDTVEDVARDLHRSVDYIKELRRAVREIAFAMEKRIRP